MIINFVSYNILSDNLSDPNFINVNKKYLDNEYRIKILIKKIKNIISNNTIFCFQEVSENQLSILSNLFFNYNFYTINFGDLAIFFSWKIFKIDYVEGNKIINLKKYINKKYHDLLIEKQNFYYILLCLIIKKNNLKINIINTHLIANPKFDNIKILQICAILKRLDELKNIIFLGDFNSLPNSDQINLILSGNINNDLIKLKIKNQYKSVFDLNFITTHTSNKITEKFSEMIDFIFYTDSIKVLKFSNLYKKINIKDYLPNKNEPSDHFILEARLKIQ